ncbi:hypothetical protein Z959_12830 [Clostridium novyi B str. ATCC 27606]|uniref:Uncharacterized protein n=1 Tax=Clostridium novyi B str. ATCC 27606 TaxID=1443123 RepID=A0AA40IRW3_CLONO|nr:MULTISPECIES: hypothetical protein [Clostridium]KEI06264.1 hypothetical protein Z957_p0035 [Clostridium sp. K25]KEI08563.1 hypothetical protein Z958_12870 [Clostridium novyi B str. NCTC 9691]KEI11974.1 hypothetical protein Z959_12830 [Clostridium novyi B str. ATCC 27606]CAG7839596.1 hypothetical protein CLOHAE12215_01009 [Clostridium haemolyticum]
MIKNLNCCCCCCLNNNLNMPQRYYIRIKNKGNLCVKYVLQYNIYCGITTKEEYVLKGQSRSPFFVENAFNICLNILNCSFPMTRLIHHTTITEYRNIAYEITGTAIAPSWREVPY